MTNTITIQYVYINIRIFMHDQTPVVCYLPVIRVHYDFIVNFTSSSLSFATFLSCEYDVNHPWASSDLISIKFLQGVPIVLLHKMFPLKMLPMKVPCLIKHPINFVFPFNMRFVKFYFSYLFVWHSFNSRCFAHFSQHCHCF